MAKAVNLMNQTSTSSEKNSNHSQEKILRNTTYLTSGFILQKILSFFYFIIIARNLGPVDLGLYDPIKSLIPIFLIIIDFSLSTVLVREIARNPDSSEKYLSNVLGLKIISSLVIILGMGLYTNFSNFSNLVKMIIYLDAIIVSLDTFTLTFFAVFRGLQNMKYEAIGMIITQIITLTFGLISLKLNWGLQYLFVAVVGGSLYNFIFSYLVLKKKIKIRITLRWDRDIIFKFLKIALPFAITAIFVKIFTYTDRFMLLKLAGQAAVGWYVTAHKLTYALEFIPSAFASSIFPAMSSFFLYSKEKLSLTFEKSIQYLIIISVPISVGMIVMANKVIIAIYGIAYETSILPLQILISGLVVVFLNFPVGAFLNACNQQKTNTINMGITVAINILLNILLVGVLNLSFTGAAIAALISGIILFTLGLRKVGQIIEYNKKFLSITFLKSLASAVFMALILYLTINYLPFYISIFFGILIYIVSIIFLKVINKSEIFILFQSFKKKFS